MLREDAYVVVQRCAMKVWNDVQRGIPGPSLHEVMRADTEAGVLLDEETLADCFSPEGFLRRVGVVFDRLAGLEF